MVNDEDFVGEVDNGGEFGVIVGNGGVGFGLAGEHLYEECK